MPARGDPGRYLPARACSRSLTFPSYNLLTCATSALLVPQIPDAENSAASKSAAGIAAASSGIPVATPFVPVPQQSQQIFGLPSGSSIPGSIPMKLEQPAGADASQGAPMQLFDDVAGDVKVPTPTQSDAAAFPGMKRATPDGKDGRSAKKARMLSAEAAVNAAAAEDDDEKARNRKGKQCNFTVGQTQILKDWFTAHIDDPYPGPVVKQQLCNTTQLSWKQVSDWFQNARCRAWAKAGGPPGSLPPGPLGGPDGGNIPAAMPQQPPKPTMPIASQPQQPQLPMPIPSRVAAPPVGISTIIPGSVPQLLPTGVPGGPPDAVKSIVQPPKPITAGGSKAAIKAVSAATAALMPAPTATAKPLNAAAAAAAALGKIPTMTASQISRLTMPPSLSQRLTVQQQAALHQQMLASAGSAIAAGPGGRLAPLPAIPIQLDASGAAHSITTATGAPIELPRPNTAAAIATPVATAAPETTRVVRRRARLPRKARELLKKWFNEHLRYPYPTSNEKEMLQKQTGLTHRQIFNWFTNRRKRDPNWCPNKNARSHKGGKAKSKSKSKASGHGKKKTAKIAAQAAQVAAAQAAQAAVAQAAASAKAAAQAAATAVQPSAAQSKMPVAAAPLGGTNPPTGASSAATAAPPSAAKAAATKSPAGTAAAKASGKKGGKKKPDLGSEAQLLLALGAG